MKTVIKLTGVVAGVAILGVLLSGCEDTDVTVPTGGVITMSTSASTVRIDPNTAQQVLLDPNDPSSPLVYIGTTMVSALIFDDRNLPQSGIVIDFQSDGEIPLDPVQKATDKNGRAETLLTVTDRDIPQVTVQARSGSVTGSLTVVVDVVGLNSMPRATATIIPLLEGQVGNIVTFDGTASSDSDGNITCYQWTLVSDNPDPGVPNPLIIQGIAASSFNRTFANQQTLSVELRVSDDTTTPAPPFCDDVNDTLNGVVEPAAVFSQDAFVTQYTLLCNNPPPTAVIAGPAVISATGTAATLTSITLDGSLSFDGETRIDRWVWNCGNGTAPFDLTPDGSIVLCRYRLGTFTATLNVTDQGTGVINPNTGTFDCQKSSPEDTVQVVITTP